MQRRRFLKTAATTGLAPLILSNNLSSQTKQDDPKVQSIRSRIKPITPEERSQRIAKAQKLMTEQNIDAVLFEGGTSLRYFTGVQWGRSERLFAMILPKTGAPFYLTPKFEESRTLEQVKEGKVYAWEENESPYIILRAALKDHDLLTAVLGIEETTRYFVTENIATAIGGVEMVNATPVTAGCRSVKSAHELELMQIANDITREVFIRAVKTLKAGLSEREFGSTVSRLFSDFGVNGGALVLFGEASAHPHGLEKDHKLREGDIVLIDGGCSVEGYASDVTRTTVFGKPSENMREVWRLVRRAQDTALAAAKPGVAAEDIDAAARTIITKGGYGPNYTYFTHRLGHGIGMEGHEWYYLVQGSNRLVQPGNVFSNEPGIYLKGEFGIRLEDEMVITEEGAKLMLSQAESLERIF